MRFSGLWDALCVAVQCETALGLHAPQLRAQSVCLLSPRLVFQTELPAAPIHPHRRSALPLSGLRQVFSTEQSVELAQAHAYYYCSPEFTISILVRYDFMARLKGRTSQPTPHSSRPAAPQAHFAKYRVALLTPSSHLTYELSPSPNSHMKSSSVLDSASMRLHMHPPHASQI